MFSKFRNKPTGAERNPDVTELVETPELRQIAALEARIKQLEKQMALLSNKFSKLAVAFDELTIKKDDAVEQVPIEVEQHAVADKTSGQKESTVILYLSAPDADGVFPEHETAETIGKSMYRLETKDGMSGRFEMIGSADAVATALISVSQFVKPACRILGALPPMPRQIVTLEQGVAKKEGETWRVMAKAIVKFE